jgi:flagellar protein FliO/FliZ
MTPLSFGTWNFGLCTFAGRIARPASITSVTRWLLVVVGCAVLAMAQPMSAAPEAASPPETSPETPTEKPVDKSVAQKSGEKTGAEKPTSPDQVIFPRNSSERPATPPAEKSSAGSNALILLTALALAAGGIWVFAQRRQAGPLSARGQRKLQIEETRPLGGRQYLVVANYDGKKFLLGMTPGRINLLTSLDDSAAPDAAAPRPSTPTEEKP